MATPAEKKALIFVAIVALLGVGVRLWRVQYPATPARSGHVTPTSPPDDDPDTRKSAKNSRKHPKNARSKQLTRRDSTSVIDLDRASIPQIEALGVLKPGLARIIVADRDTFGPFGSFRELERVPYLNKTDLRALVPRVTFSLLPRPKNAVMFQRPDSEAHRRKRHSFKATTPRTVQ